MAFFNQMGGAPSFGGGMGSSPGGASAFTSPGLDPMTLAMLLRMQGGGMGGALGGMGAGGATMGAGGSPQMPAVPQGIGAGGMIPHPGAPNMAAPGGSSTPSPAPMASALQQMGGLQGLQSLGMLPGGQGGAQGNQLATMLRGLFGGAGSNPQLASMLNSAPPTQ